MMAALNALSHIEFHVVAKVVESVLVVRAVSDVGGISSATLVVIQIVHDYADGQPEEGVQLSHPLGVALCKVVVNRDYMDAKPGKRVEIDREGRDQRFSFASLHLSNVALVQDNSTAKLY